MLPKKNRLDLKSYNNVFSKGVMIHSPLLFAKYIKNKNSQKRFSVSVSKKIYSKAVDRNRLKRVCFDEIEKILDEVLPMDTVLIIKKDYLKSDERSLRAEIKKLLLKI